MLLLQCNPIWTSSRMKKKILIKQLWWVIKTRIFIVMTSIVQKRESDNKGFQLVWRMLEIHVISIVYYKCTLWTTNL